MQLFKSMKLTTKTTMLTFTLIVLSAIAVSIVSTFVIKAEIERQVVERQSASLKIAASGFKDTFPQLKVSSDKNGAVQKLEIDGIPDFPDHTMIDKIGHLTGETATVFVWDEETKDFWRRTTNIVKPDGKRAVGTPLGQKGAVYPFMMKGETFKGEAIILGSAYYTIYQPIFSPQGKVIGILYAGVLKETMNAIQNKVQIGIGVSSSG